MQHKFSSIENNVAWHTNSPVNWNQADSGMKHFFKTNDCTRLDNCRVLMFLTPPLHYLHLLQRPAQCSIQDSVHNKFLLAGFFKHFSRLYSVHDTGPSSVTNPVLDTGHVPGPQRRRRLESQMCHSQRCRSPLRIIILSSASRDRFK